MNLSIEDGISSDKLAMLGDGGKFDPSVIPAIKTQSEDLSVLPLNDVIRIRD